MTGFVGRSHPYIAMDEVAEILNHGAKGEPWTTRKVKDWLSRAGAAKKIGAHWFTSAEMLRGSFPEIWREILVNIDDSEDW